VVVQPAKKRKSNKSEQNGATERKKPGPKPKNKQVCTPVPRLTLLTLGRIAKEEIGGAKEIRVSQKGNHVHPTQNPKNPPRQIRQRT